MGENVALVLFKQGPLEEFPICTNLLIFSLVSAD